MYFCSMMKMLLCSCSRLYSSVVLRFVNCLCWMLFVMMVCFCFLLFGIC